MQNLESGRSKEGSPVSLMVAADVKDTAGHVVIPRGALATGSVKWSRGQNTLGALSNRPPRLTINVESTEAVTGDAVLLSADGPDVEDEAIAFTRSNTGKQVDTAKLEALLKDPATSKSLEKLAQMFSEGDTNGFEDTPEAKEALAKVADELGLNETKRVVEGNELDKINSLMSGLRKGGAVATLASGGGTAALAAVTELAGVAGEVGDRLGGMLKGRSIKAYAGTPVKAKTKAPVSVTVS
jgi:hypothetical protein